MMDGSPSQARGALPALVAYREDVKALTRLELVLAVPDPERYEISASDAGI
jgi:hypothetical protein